MDIIKHTLIVILYTIGNIMIVAIMTKSTYSIADDLDPLPMAPALGREPIARTWFIGERRRSFWHAESFLELAPVGLTASSKDSHFHSMARIGLGSIRHGAKSLLFSVLSVDLIFATVNMEGEITAQVVYIPNIIRPARLGLGFGLSVYAERNENNRISERLSENIRFQFAWLGLEVQLRDTRQSRYAFAAYLVFTFPVYELMHPRAP